MAKVKNFACVFGRLMEGKILEWLNEQKQNNFVDILNLLSSCDYSPSHSLVTQCLDEVIINLKTNIPNDTIKIEQCCNGIFVNLIGEDLAGFLMVRKVFEDVDLDYLCSNPHFRQMGIARNLLYQLFNYCQVLQVRRILLEVGEKNLPAMQLYRSCGFKIIAERRGYYQGGESAYVMAREV